MSRARREPAPPRWRRAVAALPAGLLVALWVACAVLHVKQVAGGQLAWVGVYVATPSDDADVPTVRGFWPGATPDARGALQEGDRVLRVGDADLRGSGPIGFAMQAWGATATYDAGAIPVVYARAGAVHTTTIALVPAAYPWRMLPLTCTLVATATLVLLRRPGVRVVRSFFLAALAFSLHWTFFFGSAPWQTASWILVFAAASVVMLPLVLRAFLVFPAAVASSGGRLPWWPWLFAIFGPASMSWVFGMPAPPETGARVAFATNVAFIVTLLAVITRNFRRAGPSGRRQLKWVLLGMYVGTVPVLVADAVAAVAPALAWLHEPAAVAEIAIPLSVVVAIVRANFLDVDRLITSTAVYSILSILLLAIALVLVPHLAGAVSAATDVDSDVVQPLLSVAVAAAIMPLRRLVRPRLERLLFHERHALRTGVHDLLRELAEAGGPQELFALVGERLETLVHPRSCRIYAPLAEGFAPVFTVGDGSRDATPLAADGALVAALRAQAAVVDVAQWRRATRPGPAACAELEATEAAVLLPVSRGAELAAVVSLGSKRSGDVYTATDLALLAAVADKVSSTLLHFDAAVILQQEREMSEALRRYVPQPVAARLQRGEAIQGGQEDVAVLFVDIRGYTAYSERQAADAVFSLVNRYIHAVSAVIQRRGGTVVEFLGDGVMAVFGAPEPVPDHARAAVQAARDVVDTVQRLAASPDEAGAPVTVGVGIASGPAFVGNVRTHDRLVYTAVGDVVNLASRIERLTRQLEAAIAIDARTYERAGAAAARFRRHVAVAIRGRSEPVDVYALPLGAVRPAVPRDTATSRGAA